MDTPEEVARKALNAVRRERYRRKKEIASAVNTLARKEAKRLAAERAKKSYARMLRDSKEEATALAKASEDLDQYFPRVGYWRIGTLPVPGDFGDAEVTADIPERGVYTEEQNDFLNTAQPGIKIKPSHGYQPGDGIALTSISHPNTLSWWGRLRFWLWGSRY